MQKCCMPSPTSMGRTERIGSGKHRFGHGRELGIAVHSSPEGNRDAVGEHCTGMLLGALHKLRSGDASIRQHQWLREAHRGRELKSMTVGIVGYGHMGSAFAERLAGFGCRVLAYDKYKEGWGEQPTTSRPIPHVEPVGWDAFRQQVDVVSLHLPWTAETKGMVDDAWLGQFDKPIFCSTPPEAPLSKPRPFSPRSTTGA